MKKFLIGTGVVIVLGIAYYGLSPFFKNNTLNEALPQTQSLEEGAVAQEPIVGAAAAVVPTPTHPAEGTVRLVASDGRSFLRYENFKTINGPDVRVYLSKDIQAKDFIDLGPLKATEGNINYEIPTGVDPKDYPYALVWCEDFNVLFNSAKLF